jgi:hypothetical protein
VVAEAKSRAGRKARADSGPGTDIRGRLGQSGLGWWRQGDSGHGGGGGGGSMRSGRTVLCLVGARTRTGLGTGGVACSYHVGSVTRHQGRSSTRRIPEKDSRRDRKHAALPITRVAILTLSVPTAPCWARGPCCRHGSPYVRPFDRPSPHSSRLPSQWLRARAIVDTGE